MNEDNIIKGKAVCEWIVFNKNDFTIAKFRAVGDEPNLPLGSFTIKGNIFVEVGEEYVVSAIEDTKTTYANSYDAIRVAKDIDVSTGDPEMIRALLEGVLSESKANLLMESLDNPAEALMNEDYELLTSVKGVGMETAKKMVRKYQAQKDYTIAFVELSKYKFTPRAIIKICNHFTTPEEAVTKIKENPYVLTEVEGYGFNRADTIFLNDPENKPTDKRRVIAYIKYLFEKEQGDGNSWITPQQFVENLREFIPNADLEFAVNHVMKSGEYVVERDFGDEIRISTHEVYDMEMAIAKELIRLQEAKCSMNLDGYEEVVRQVEEAKGIKYGDEQMQSIRDMIDNNVYMLQGLAGSGKSTAVAGFISSIDRFGYSFSQCALSGKAADNLTKITGRQGYTIHSLIKYGLLGLQHDKDNPLPANAIILDELSMVSAEIFLALLRAIQTGSKLIMIGDYGQLEAIGIGIMGGLIRSKVVPMTLLKEIRRQAKESAIITHSISVRNGQAPKELKLTKDTQATYGKKQDLEYIIVDNESEKEIFNKTIVEFKHALSKYDINDVQILTQTKKSGVASTYELNNMAQMIFNPVSEEKDKVELGTKDNPYVVQVGDKVMNTRNRKDTYNPDNEQITPIYNGNTGIVESITVVDNGESKNTMIVINFDGIGKVLVDGEAIESIELGYAVTIHKSQGSTIKCVIMALPFHYLLNTKELLYTGMTRASEHLTLITSPRSFRRAIKTTAVKKKQTNLAEMLIKETKGESIKIG